MNKTIVIDDNCRVLLPEDIREALNLHPGDELLVQREGMKLVLRSKLKSHAQRLRGLHKCENHRIRGDLMSLEEKIIGQLDELSESRKAEVLDFVEYLRAKGEGKDISEDAWLRAASTNTAFEFLRAPEEDIYTIEDGKPFNDQG